MVASPGYEDAIEDAKQKWRAMTPLQEVFFRALLPPSVEEAIMQYGEACRLQDGHVNEKRDRLLAAIGDCIRDLVEQKVAQLERTIDKMALRMTELLTSEARLVKEE